MAKYESRQGDAVKFEDKSTILHQAFGTHEVQATLPDGSKGTGCDEDKGKAEDRAYYHAKEAQARHS